MTEHELTESERQQLKVRSANRVTMMKELLGYEAEWNGLPVVVACAIPLLIFGSLFMSVIGLESKWWYLGLIGIPVVIGRFYPLILIDRLKTPLLLNNGKKVAGWSRRKFLIGFAVLSILWLFRFEIFQWIVAASSEIQTAW